MKFVVDASVIVKWVVPDPAREAHVDQALWLLSDLQNARIEVLQPPHWLAEVAAVITRLRPKAAELMIDLLVTLDLSIAGDVVTLKRASRLAQELDHHLFDTLYHAVALEHDSVLVTADDRYYRKAKDLGSALPLQAWAGPETRPTMGPVRLRAQ